jgi:hypothetical protein
LFKQIRDAIGKRARLARTGAGDDERGAGRRGDGGQLLRVEFARVINLQMDCSLTWFQNVIARHRAQLKWQTTIGKRKNCGNVSREGREDNEGKRKIVWEESSSANFANRR